MITYKTKKEIELLKEGGQKLAEILFSLLKETKPGISAAYLDVRARELMSKIGARPSFLNYKADFSSKPFPGALCVSVNEVVVHGLPRRDLVFKEGDVVSLDIGMEYKGLFTDMAYTIVVGEPKNEKVKDLLKAVREALKAGIGASKAGNTLKDISLSIEKTLRRFGFLPVCELTGHGVGYQVHEDPYVFNCVSLSSNLKLKENLVLALEPMAGLGSNKVIENKDEEFLMSDKKVSAHFEQTIAITSDEPIIITPFFWEEDQDKKLR